MVRLALIAMVVSGCLWKPTELFGKDGGGGDDGGGSGSGSSDAGVHSNLIPRVVGKAYYSTGTVPASPNTDNTKYTIVPSTIHDGDLLLLIGSIDNSPIVGLPAGFTSLATGLFGADTQTYWVYEHLVTSAAAEPPEYMAGYTVDGSSHTTSGASTILLVAIPGASPNMTFATNAPDDCFDKALNGTCGMRPAVDAWFVMDHHNTFSVDAGFTILDAFGDYGMMGGGFTWSSMMVAYKFQDATSAYPITGTFTSDDDRGMPFSIAMPLHPGP